MKGLPNRYTYYWKSCGTTEAVERNVSIERLGSYVTHAHAHTISLHSWRATLLLNRSTLVHSSLSMNCSSSTLSFYSINGFLYFLHTTPLYNAMTEHIDNEITWIKPSALDQEMGHSFCSCSKIKKSKSIKKWEGFFFITSRKINRS